MLPTAYTPATTAGNTRAMAAYDESTRAYQAIAAEIGDYSQRVVADSTSTFGELAKAQSVPEAFELWAAYSKRAMEQHVEQLSRIASMYASAAEVQTRAVQSMMVPSGR
jgi:hypothetical protein